MNLGKCTHPYSHYSDQGKKHLNRRRSPLSFPVNSSPKRLFRCLKTFSTLKWSHDCTCLCRLLYHSALLLMTFFVTVARWLEGLCDSGKESCRVCVSKHSQRFVAILLLLGVCVVSFCRVLANQPLSTGPLLSGGCFLLLHLFIKSRLPSLKWITDLFEVYFLALVMKQIKSLETSKHWSSPPFCN